MIVCAKPFSLLSPHFCDFNMASREMDKSELEQLLALSSASIAGSKPLTYAVSDKGQSDKDVLCFCGQKDLPKVHYVIDHEARMQQMHSAMAPTGTV